MPRIKTNDTVVVLKGRDKSKKGKVIQSFPKLGLIVVEGLNIRFKHLKSQKRAQRGEKVQFSCPIRVDNVALVCPKCNEKTRVAYKILDNRKKVRECKKCRELID